MQGITIFNEAFKAQLKEDYKKSYKLYLKLLDMQPEEHVRAIIYYNIGLIMMGNNQYKEAIKSFDKSNAIKKSGQNDWNKSLCFLNLGDWNSAMKFYKFRYAKDNRSNPTSVHLTELPLVFLDDLNLVKNKKILVLNEQGLGDQILFSSQIEKLSKIVESATIQTSIELFELFNHIYVYDNIRFEVFDNLKAEKVSQYDAYMILGDIFTSAYEFGNPCSLDLYSPGNSKKIGICWESNKNSPIGKKRSIDPKILKNKIKFELVSLQFNAGSEIGLEDFKPKNFLDTWNKLDTLDVVVTVDTSVAHLAGLKGIPTLLVIKNFFDWRWKFRDQEYPNYSMFYPMLEIVNISDNLNEKIKYLID